MLLDEIDEHLKVSKHDARLEYTAAHGSVSLGVGWLVLNLVRAQPSLCNDSRLVCAERLLSKGNCALSSTTLGTYGRFRFLALLVRENFLDVEVVRSRLGVVCNQEAFVLDLFGLKLYSLIRVDVILADITARAPPRLVAAAATDACHSFFPVASLLALTIGEAATCQRAGLNQAARAHREILLATVKVLILVA